MKRITERQLEIMTERLNEIVGFDENVKYSTIGAYTISYAYGGVSLHQYVNEHGAIKDVFSCGHIPKRDLYNRIMAYMEGMKCNANNVKKR